MGDSVDQARGDKIIAFAELQSSGFAQTLTPLSDAGKVTQ
jgi:hypothetical protein